MQRSCAGLSLYIHNSKPQAAQITKSFFSHKNLYWPMPQKISKIIILNSHNLKGDFFSQLLDFLVILDQEIAQQAQTLC